MIDDHQLLAAAPDVNYKDLSAQPSPQDFLVLTRVRGTMSVAQLCNTSGLGREKTLEAIAVLVEVGLLTLVSEDGTPISRPPNPSTAPPVVPLLDDVEDAPDPFEDALPLEEPYAGQMLDSEAIDAFGDAIPLGATQSEPFEIERHPPAMQIDDDSFGIEVSLEPADNISLNQPVSFAVSDEEDDLFLASSPAHIDRLEGRAPLLRGKELHAAVTSGPQSSPAASAQPKPEPSKPEPKPEPQKVVEQPAQDQGKINSARRDDAESKSARRDEGKINSARRDEGESKRAAAYHLFPIPWDEYQSEHAAVPGVDPNIQREVDYVFDNLEYLDFYQLFGVAPADDRKALRTSYFDLSKRFHPDKFYSDDAPALKERVATIFRYVTKGYETLSKPNKRAAYDEALRQARDAAAASDAEEERKRAMAAEMLERRAGQLEQQGHFAQAAGELKKVGALRRDPHALVRAASLYLRANVQLDEAATLARGAIRALPQETEPRLVLGQIYEKNHMYDEALTVFTEAETLAPDDPSIRVHLERIRARKS